MTMCTCNPYAEIDCPRDPACPIHGVRTVCERRPTQGEKGMSLNDDTSRSMLIGCGVPQLQEQIAALTAERDALRREVGMLAEGKRQEFERRVDLQAERGRLRKALLAVEWTGLDRIGGLDTSTCVNEECGQMKCRGHAPDCIVGLAMEGMK